MISSLQQSILTSLRQMPRHLPLRVVLTAPFVLQIMASTGAVGYLAYRNGQQAVNDLANQLMEQASDRIDQHLNSYLTSPYQINQTNLDAIEAGLFDIYDFDTAGRFFRLQFDTYNVGYISYGLASGEFIGAGYFDGTDEIVIDEVSDRTQGQDYVYATDDQGNRAELIFVGEYDFFDEDWYKATVEQGVPTWSEVYAWEELPEDLWISISSPIHDDTGDIVGVMSVDFLLSEISSFIKGLTISPNSRMFIVEPDGSLIAQSSDAPITVVTDNPDDPVQRTSIYGSDDPIAQATTTYLTETFGGLDQISATQQLSFRHGSERWFVLVRPWKNEMGLNWLAVTVVPEDDFMAQIHKNTRNTIALSLLTVFIAIYVGIKTARWVTNPLIKLTRAAKAIEQGNLDLTVDLNRQDELGELAQSFNHMATQLSSSFQDLQTLNAALTESEKELQRYSATLEDQVQARTQELSMALEQLKATQADLVESEKLAALGQLIAGIAHEINTPLGAIQASIGNIDHSLRDSLRQIPVLFQMIPAERLSEFFNLLDATAQPRQLLSSREERQLRRQLTQTLTDQGIAQAGKLADMLSKMGISEGIDDLLNLLHHPDVMLILESAYSLSSIQTNSQNIQLAVERAAKIVFALKVYAHQDQTGHQVQASITEGIDTVLTLYQNQIKQGIEVVKTYEPIPPILCYPDELVQVWSNLIMNSIQAMNCKGKLAINVSRQGPHVKVEIADSGVGISKEHTDRIFTPFFTTKPMGEGSGLGLHIVRQIMEKHHGTIEVTSQPGHTVFTVKIPFSEV
ncbi:MAG: histidine kinase [Leptolyngbya sp.]|nr:MAG: histidine kinase [Leptolyngbya sp.]